MFNMCNMDEVNKAFALQGESFTGASSSPVDTNNQQVDITYFPCVQRLRRDAFPPHKPSNLSLGAWTNVSMKARTKTHFSVTGKPYTKL